MYLTDVIQRLEQLLKAANSPSLEQLLKAEQLLIQVLIVMHSS